MYLDFAKALVMRSRYHNIILNVPASNKIILVNCTTIILIMTMLILISGFCLKGDD